MTFKRCLIVLPLIAKSRTKAIFETGVKAAVNKHNPVIVTYFVPEVT